MNASYEVKNWLNMQIGAMVVQSVRTTVDGVELCNFSNSDHIHIGSNAVREISKMFKLPMSHKDRIGDTDYPHEISFEYNGVTFIALESEREYQKRGEVV